MSWRELVSRSPAHRCTSPLEAGAHKDLGAQLLESSVCGLETDIQLTTVARMPREVSAT